MHRRNSWRTPVIVILGLMAGAGIWSVAPFRTMPAVPPAPSAPRLPSPGVESRVLPARKAPGRAKQHAVAPAAIDPDSDADGGAGGDEFLFKIRAFPHGRIPRGARARAFAQARRLRSPRELLAAQAIAGPADSTRQWTLIGPKPTADGYAGRVTALAIDPRDNKTIYLGGAEGGVWKTTDGGSTWNPLTDFQPVLAIGSLALDPSNPDVVYAGTGEANFNQDGYGGLGILKSSDGGNTWSLIGSDIFDGQSVGALAISPADTRVILAGSFGGLFRSADAGQTWQNLMPGLCTAILFDPRGSVAYAAVISFGSPQPAILKSTDSGQTWTSASGTGTGAIQFSGEVFRIALALAPSSPSTLYAGVYNNGATQSTPLAAFYRTTDGGASWQQVGGQAYCGNQCWYNNVIAVSPANPNLLLGGGVDLTASSDGGKTWSLAAFNVHVDQHAIAFTPDGSQVYVGNDGGVWSSSAPATYPSTWTNHNSTLALTQFYAGLSVAPGNPSVSFGGTQDNRSLADFNSDWQSIACGDGAATAIDPINPQNVYTACAGLPPGQGVLQRSAAGGKPGTFVPIEAGLSTAEGTPFVPYLTIDPSQPQNLYFTGNQHIYQTTNSGTFWQAISPDVTAGLLWPCAIAVAPTDSNTVYSGSCDGVAKVTHNALSGTSSTWQDISAGLPGTAITHITVDPRSHLTAYATVSGFETGHVYRTSDGGKTWSDLGGNLPDISVNDLVIDPDLAGTLYVATDAGVFWTNTTGQFWSELGTGLPQAAVLSLAFEHTTRTLRAATHGRSVWDLLMPLDGLNLIPVVTSASPAQIPLAGPQPVVTVTGANFTSATVGLWNGQPRPVTFVSSTELHITPTAADVAIDSLAALTVFTPGPGGGVSSPYYIKVGPNPAVFPDGFLNAASFEAGNGVAPGSIISVFGANLAAGSASFNTLPLPAGLAGASLAVADPADAYSGSASLFFVSAGQINAQVPWEVLPGDKATFAPARDGVKGALVSVDIQIGAPGIFTVDQSGKGQGSVTNAITGQLAAPTGKYPNSAPVKRGDYLSIYCTGLGAVDQQQSDGVPASGDTLARTFIQPVVLIGAVSASVTFSGLAPGYVGLYQVNVQVPPNAPVGNAVPMTISDGFGDVSNIVTVAIE